MIDSIINFTSRSYFTIDSNKGFSQFKDCDWKPILVDVPDPNDPDTLIKKVTYDFTVANEFLTNYEPDTQKTFLFNIFVSPQEFLNTFAGLFNKANMEYRSAFWKNDVSAMPIQYIVVSPFSIPDGFAHLFNFIEAEYPSIKLKR